MEVRCIILQSLTHVLTFFLLEVRPEAIYLHGTNDMNTNDVFQYFRDYGPSCVEWIDDSSCE